jgi:Tfp pilus assembly protein PilP
VQNASLAAAALNDPTASPLAVAISRKPAARPADLSRAVEAAVAAAVRAPEPEAPAKDAAPEADNEPETASAAPKLPTSASVAKQATFKNAINLSKVNLIGVYGTQSNRYALVRQANGKYKKVRVGDSIDGGKVAAITASELRYQKGSKMLTLALPQG